MSRSKSGAPRLTLVVLLKQIMLYAPSALVPAAFGLMSTAVFTRMLDSSSYGKFTLVLNMSTLVAAIGSQWLQQGISRYLPVAQDVSGLRRLRGAITLGLMLVALAVFLLMVVTVSIVARGGDWFFLGLSGSLVAVGLTVFGPLGTVLQAEMQAGKHTAFHVVHVVCRFVIAMVLLLTTQPDASDLLWGYAVALLLLIPPLWGTAGLPKPWKVWRVRTEYLAELRRLFCYGAPMIGWFISANLLNVGDTYVIQLFHGSEQVGIYSANYGLLNGAVGLMTQPVLKAAHPFLMSAWAQGSEHQTSKWLAGIVGWFLVLGGLLTGAVAIFARDVALFMLGPAFQEGYRVIPIVLVGMVVWQLGMYTHKPLEFAGQTRLMLRTSIAVAILNIALNVLFVPMFGYLAAAITTVVSYAVYTIFTARAGRKWLRWEVPWRPVLVSFSQISISFLGIWLMRSAVAGIFGYWPGLVVATLAVLAVTLSVLKRATRTMLVGSSL